MRKDKITVIGAGGHSKVVVDAIVAQDKFQIEAIIDDDITKANFKFLDYDIVHSSQIDRVQARNFVVALGCDATRKEKFDLYQKLGFSPVTIIHPNAIVSQFADIGVGNMIFAGAIINPHAHLKDNIIINTAAVIEHDVVISNHGQISPGAVVCGACCLSEFVNIGAGAVVKPNIRIGKNVVVGAGATVVKHIEFEGIYVGTPAKKLS